MSTTTVTLAGKTVEVDEEGYLKDRSEWTEEMAKEMAKADNCDLTDNHWEVIRFMREYYEEYQISPPVRSLTKAVAKKLGPEKGNSKYLYELFPYGPAKQACKYAGLPKPGGCL
jgi:tRNA 2-thiouridine synthesizing protein E